MEDITSFNLERNVEIFFIHISSREVAETKLVKISPFGLKSEVNAIDQRNLYFQMERNLAIFFRCI